jgi:hypothetical protein
MEGSRVSPILLPFHIFAARLTDILVSTFQSGWGKDVFVMELVWD